MRFAACLLLVGIILFVACTEDEPLSVDGTNERPVVLIRSPLYSGADPTEILARPTLVVEITDPDDPPAGLSFRWSFLSTVPFNEDWVAAEDSVLSTPDSLAWSDWHSYVPSDTGMAVTVTDSLDFGFHVLAVQARDPNGAISELGDDSMRRIIAGNGLNDPPVVTIHSPVSNAPDPVDIDAQPTLRIEVTDVDDVAADLSFRWTFVRTSSYAQDWTATEDDIRTNPEEVAWSDWTTWAPEDDGTMSVAVPAPLAFAPYVLAVQAKDRNARRSDIGAGSLRRVRVCDAVNDPPVVNIFLPVSTPWNPATVPPIATFSLEASDLDNDAGDLSVRWAMVSTQQFDDSYPTTIDYLRKDPTVLAQYGKTPEDAEAEWSAWAPYASPVITVGPMDFGDYIFAVQTQDPCDGFNEALDEATNVRRIRVSSSPVAPLLTVRNRHVGAVHSGGCDPAPVIATIFAGMPMSFEFEADASSYGGLVAGYRYGWDIDDLDDDSQWDIDYTPFAHGVARTPLRTYFFGTHTFHLEVIDYYGFCTRAEIRLNYIQYAPTRDLLLVDDFATDKSASAGWDNPTGNGILPSDEEHDQFWLDMLDNVSGFDPALDAIEVTGSTPIPLTVLADYKNIIWSVSTDVAQSSGLPLLYEYLRYRQKEPPPGTTRAGVREPNPLALFMEAGGHILINGRHPLTTTINRTFAPASRFPFMFPWDQEGNQDQFPDLEPPFLGDESFAYLHLCLATMDFAIPSTALLRNNNYVCSVQSLRPVTSTSIRDDGMREAIPLDPWFPRLELRVETAGGTKAYSPSRRSYEAEVYNPQYFIDNCVYVIRAMRCFEPIYGLQCLNTSSATYNAPVAFWTSAFENAGGAPGMVAARSAVFGFPLVYFDPAQVKPALEYILFNEWQIPRSP